MQILKTRVLLVEDEDLARKTLSFYLNTIFDEVVLAKDGAEGILLIKENYEKNDNFDLVLTDLNMPNLSGIQMIDEILKLIPNQRFIIVSAHKNEEDLLKLINLRVCGYFVKPLNIDNMMEMLQKAKEEVLKDKQPKEVKNKALISLNNSYTFDLSANKLYCKNIIVKLSKKESEILDVLIQNLGEIISVDKFKEIVWDDITINDSSFRTVMKRLKDKIKDDDFIISHKGYGYIIEKVLSK
ncbi:two-component system response regulator [Arcobacter acticola]|jgi:DNA-binding response OmpR family regulator|uniref:Two-component system response regulator n=1 Tax=Arcobacter acticola TaxID=1849015 RepID=A0A6M8EZ91_9BACT|nr:response regulator transcription factor [Arcobacter acticola]QKE29887.1 two-component system response regulator [Arcobacter acticola]